MGFQVRTITGTIPWDMQTDFAVAHIDGYAYILIRRAGSTKLYSQDLSQTSLNLIEIPPPKGFDWNPNTIYLNAADQRHLYMGTFRPQAPSPSVPFPSVSAFTRKATALADLDYVGSCTIDSQTDFLPNPSTHRISGLGTPTTFFTPTYMLYTGIQQPPFVTPLTNNGLPSLTGAKDLSVPMGPTIASYQFAVVIGRSVFMGNAAGAGAVYEIDVDPSNLNNGLAHIYPNPGSYRGFWSYFTASNEFLAVVDGGSDIYVFDRLTAGGSFHRPNPNKHSSIDGNTIQIVGSYLYFCSFVGQNSLITVIDLDRKSLTFKQAIATLTVPGFSALSNPMSHISSQYLVLTHPQRVVKPHLAFSLNVVDLN